MPHANLLRSSTVTRIIAVRESQFAPLLAEIDAADGERLPVFDAEIVTAAHTALVELADVLLHRGWGRDMTTPYLRALTPIDVTAATLLCPSCEETRLWNIARLDKHNQCWVPLPPQIMTREEPSPTNGNVPQFVCPGCHRRIYLAPVEATAIELPCTARARLNRLTDGLFALDHVHQQATLMDSIPHEVSPLPPYHGIHAVLEPYAETFVLDGLGLAPYRRSRRATDPLLDPIPTNLTLRLQGQPFDGRLAYQVL